MRPITRRLSSALLVVAVFLACLFAGHALGNTAIGGIAGLFAAALLGDWLTGCGICSFKRRDRR